MRSKSLRGFTLIELLIVIVIIGILAAGAVTLFSGAQGKARDAKRKADLNAIATSVQLYAADHNSDLPSPATELDDDLVAGKYLQKKAVSPKGVGKEVYCYYWNANGEYALASLLEDSTIPTTADRVYTVGNAVSFSTIGATDFISSCPDSTPAMSKDVVAAD